MKAIIQSSYGPPRAVLTIGDRERPVPGPDEVLVRVRAASVHADVWHVVTGLPLVLRLMGAGLRRPKNPVPGTDLAGIIESVGTEGSRFRPGDEVFGETIRGMQWINGGAYAEYAVLPESGVAHKPANISFEQAAGVATAGLIALQNLPDRAQLGGKNVLINGAAGGVGSIALQIGRASGARVTGVDARKKLDYLRQLGADHVIDYQHEDCTRSMERYDLIYDVASTLSFADCIRVLTPGGKYVMIGHDHYGTAGRHLFGNLPAFFRLTARALFSDHLPPLSFALLPKPESLAYLRELLTSGQLTPIVDRVFPLAEAAAALEYLTSGSARGRIILVP